MAPVLPKRSIKGARLNANDFDTAMTDIEVGFGIVESRVAALEALIAGTGGDRVVDLRDFAIDFTGSNDATGEVNTALLQAYTSGYPCAAPAGSIRVSTLRWPTRVEFFGAGIAHTSILADGSNGAIIKSKNLFTGDAHAGNMQGRAALHHMKIVGSNNQSLANQDGIVLRDFFSRIYDLELVGCGGKAIRLTEVNDAGTRTATGAQNQIRDVAIYENRGIQALVLGDTGSVQMSEGVLENVTVNVARTGANTGYTPVYIGNADRWRVRNVRVYSFHPTVGSLVAPATAIHLVRPWHTQLRDAWLGHWANAGVYVEGGGILMVDGLTAVADSAVVGGTAFYADGSATLGNPAIDLAGLGLSKATGTQAVFAITAANNATINVAHPPTREGARLGDITLYRELTGGLLFAPNAVGQWAGI